VKFRDWLKLGALACALAVILSLIGALLVGRGAWVTPGHAHDWYPMECCHEQDCAPVISATSEVEATADALMPAQLVVTTKFGTVAVPHGFERKPSPDGRMHACIRKDGNGDLWLICFFVPAQG
jgi:hypothetical protein